MRLVMRCMGTRCHVQVLILDSIRPGPSARGASVHFSVQTASRLSTQWARMLKYMAGEDRPKYTMQGPFIRMGPSSSMILSIDPCTGY